MPIARRRTYGGSFEDTFDPGLLPGMEDSIWNPPPPDMGPMTDGETQPPSTPAPTTKYATAGFDPSKIGTGHEKESPKYAFESVFSKYAPGQHEDAFKELQTSFPEFFKDWSLSGDKIRYGGSGGPHGAFDGLTEFDIQRDFDGGGPWHWEPTVAGGWQPDGIPAGAPPGLFTGASGFGGGGSAGGAGSFSRSGPIFGDEVMAALRGMFPGGAFNEGIVNRRTELARETLNRQRQSRSDTNRAALASRGLIGDGPELESVERLDESIADQYANAVSGIFADESENADNRMIQALMTAAGLTESEARMALERELGWGNIQLGHRRAGIDETLGLGNLALGNMRAVNDYNLGAGRLGLDRDISSAGIEDAVIGRMIQLIQLYLQGAGQAAGGYVGRR